ncbi:MAG TPA: hypothetical protein VGC58_02125, partial [Candidatus Paceibacterota bacterium]
MGLLLQVISGNRYGGFGLAHVVGFLYVKMNPKVKKLLDDLQDDDGSITLSRPHFDLLINMMTPKSEEVR